MKMLVLVIVLASSTAFAQSAPQRRVQVPLADPIENVRELRRDLEKISGVVVRMGGIDTLGALRRLSDAIVDIDRRVAAMEKARK